MATVFVIVGTQRTGTTLIRTSLDSHPDALCSGEVFKSGKRPYKKPDGYWAFCRETLSNRIRHYIARRRNVCAFLDRLLSRPDAQAVGFKIMYSHARRYPEVVEYLRRHQLCVIHVTRRNFLRTLISRDVARLTGIYHRTANSAQSAAAAIELDVSTLVHRLRGISSEEGAWDSLLLGHSRVHKVCYEDFIDDRPAVTRKLLQFLGLRYTELNSPLEKVNASDMRHLISNYGEVEKALRATPFYGLLA
jgi:LPS sulfotransferase NodH